MFTRHNTTFATKQKEEFSCNKDPLVYEIVGSDWSAAEEQSFIACYAESTGK